MNSDLATGEDGLARCSWALSAPELTGYHDAEWGMPLTGDDELFERICLEAFQCGLSWLTILRKRDAFRSSFAAFEIDRVAGYGESEVESLLGEAGIVRNRAKIVASIENAKRSQETIEELGSLAQLIWSFVPPEASPPNSYAEIPTVTSESEALSRELRRRGFRFLGPVTVCALMQACGLINAHLEGCHARERVEKARAETLAQLTLG